MLEKEPKNLPLIKKVAPAEKKEYVRPKVKEVPKQVLQETLSAEEKRRMIEALEKIHGPKVKAKLQEDLQISEQPEQAKEEAVRQVEQELTLLQKIAQKTKDPFSYWSFLNSRYFNQTGLLTPWHVLFRKIGRAEIKSQGFESFEAVEIDDINISKIEKMARKNAWEPGMHYETRGEIKGEANIRGALFGPDQIKLKWEADLAELLFEGSLLKYEVYVGFKQKETDLQATVSDLATLESVNKIMEKYHLDEPIAVGRQIYQKVLEKLTREIETYALAKCMPYEIYRYDRALVRSKFETDISQGLDQIREQEIIEGLKNRQFDEKIFYYGPGAEKYLQILKSPEYKLANLEIELIKKHLPELEPYLQGRTIYDLGAANALKAIPLLEKQMETQDQVDYVPVDINPAFVFEASAEINNPKVNIEGKILDFTKPLAGKLGDKPKLLTLLGSTLGNGDQVWQEKLLKNLGQVMTADDALLVGVHLHEYLQQVLKLYDNPAGREFVMATVKNLGFPENKIELEMVADEGARQIKQIIHIKEDLVVKRRETEITFKKGEQVTIFVSQKYEVGELELLAQKAGLTIEKSFFDPKKQWELAVLRKK